MRMEERKKKILIIAIIFIVFITGLVIFLLTRGKDSEKLDTEINQGALRKTASRNIDIDKKVKFPIDRIYYIWEVSDKLSLEKLKNLVSSIGFSLEQSSSGHFYRWTKGDSAIFYELNGNTVMFMGDDILSVDNMDNPPEEILSKVVKKYFGKEWKYKVTHTEKRTKGEIVYFANRYLEGENIIEISDVDSDTDYIALKDNKIVYAKLLLTDFINTGKKTELIEHKEFSANINSRNYPGQFYAKIGSLSLDIQEEMRNDREMYTKFYDHIGNCRGEKISIVYLYKHLEQEVLTPVYRVDAQCDSMYKEEKILIPAVFYLNAIDLEYIKTETKK